MKLEELTKEELIDELKFVVEQWRNTTNLLSKVIESLAQTIKDRQA